MSPATLIAEDTSEGTSAEPLEGLVRNVESMMGRPLHVTIPPHLIFADLANTSGALPREGQWFGRSQGDLWGFWEAVSALNRATQHWHTNNARTYQYRLVHDIECANLVRTDLGMSHSNIEFLQPSMAQFSDTIMGMDSVSSEVPSPSIERAIVHSYRLKKEAIASIKDLITAREPQEVEYIEQQLYDRLAGHAAILRSIILDETNLINVRAMAARLYSAKMGGPTALDIPKMHDLLDHKSPLIRLGLVLGFADAHNWEMVCRFMEDPHPRVAEEARELLGEFMSESKY